MILYLFDLILNPLEDEQPGVTLIDDKFLPSALHLSIAFFILTDEMAENGFEIFSGILSLAQLEGF